MSTNKSVAKSASIIGLATLCSRILGFIRDVLTDEGYEMVEAIDGAEALDLATRQPPDLILLDMRLPVLDGWQFADAYRATPGPHAPIIVMTAARDAAGIATEIQAQGYLAKPFNLDDLLAVIRKYSHREIASS